MRITNWVNIFDREWAEVNKKLNDFEGALLEFKQNQKEHLSDDDLNKYRAMINLISELRYNFNNFHGKD